jgi:hypothetical protein
VLEVSLGLPVALEAFAHGAGVMMLPAQCPPLDRVQVLVGAVS